ncbi:MAG: glycosyltransferase [Oryzomonas sp.]|jgi:cellulose synthase/poly-beta-1,6-N-acetylglucosamine synthase-like glycosyltransferase
MTDKLVSVLLALQPLFFIYFIILNSFYTIFTIISLREIRRCLTTFTTRSLNNSVNDMFYRPLSILVPAYNEEKNIVSTVNSLLELRYPEYELIIINDGSSDKTLQNLIEGLALVKIEKPIRLVISHQQIRQTYISPEHPTILVIDKENGGKSDALNAGINAAQFPLFCTVDADSLLEADALVRVARLFVEDREVIATGGIVRVLNGCEVEKGVVKTVRAPAGLLECFQAVEYAKGFLSGRTAWSRLRSLLIISGTFGLFRKDLVMAINGFRKCMGEDMDLVVRLHRHCRTAGIPYKIVFIPDPVCWTQVPSDIVSLLKQRNRWQRGLIESLLYNWKLLLNPRHGIVGLFAFPYFIFIEALGPVFEFFGYFSFLVLLLLGKVDREFGVLFFLVAVLWGTWISFGSILLDNLIYRRYRGVRDILKLALFSFLEYFGYRQLIAVDRLFATFFFWEKRSWGKQKRREISPS